MKFSMVRRINDLPTDGSVSIGQLTWADSDRDVFMFRRLNRLMIVTAFRLGEVVHHNSGEIMYLTLASLTWLIAGVVVTSPNAAQLASLVPGRDRALLTPPRSKPDQWGEIHCPFPVSLTFDPANPIDAASGLRDIELLHLNAGQPANRPATPLFSDAQQQPYRHHFLHNLLKRVLTHLYGEAVAKLYTWHSYRSGLATALHAAGVDDAMIQLICRWMCPESLHVYRRMGISENERLTKSAMHANVSTIQTSNIPKIDSDQGYAHVHESLGSSCPEWSTAAASTITPFRTDLASRPTPLAADATAAAAPKSRPTPRAANTTMAAALETLDGPPSRGQTVAVPSSVWPTYSCRELDGRGWEAIVLSVSSTTALIRFANATTRDGRPYENERLPLSALAAVPVAA